MAVAGDFTSADTVQVSPLPDPAAADPFAYAADNPLTFTDPTGHLIAPAGSPATNPHYMDQLTYGVTYTGLVKKAGPVAAKKAATAAVASRQALIKAGNALKAKQQKAAAAKRAAQEKAAKAKAAKLAAQKAAAARKAATSLKPKDKPYLLPGTSHDIFINPGHLTSAPGS